MKNGLGKRLLRPPNIEVTVQYRSLQQYLYYEIFGTLPNDGLTKGERLI